MTKTVTSLFHSERHAIIAASRLEQAGIPKAEIDIWTAPINLAPLLEDEGVSRADAHAYSEGVMRGGSVIIVSCADHDVGKVVQILDDEGVLDLDEQRASWQSEGWEGPEAPARSDEAGHGRVRIQSREDRPIRE
ncbi:hypothetical protein MHY87_08115 [Microvirga sp. ACRRW]|uniref:hypothetical protein n=1 Tax=Microvirga sp. ACRRW TaxID=2918205 RepID=UPI001EF4D8E2|nr:hypothetical protein [Microvirga sp. ACRRW]MCG7392866.1 hypothetical protein [Microvirga sp. ACRRW]